MPDLPAGLNRPDGTVEVVPYDPAWPARFEGERDAPKLRLAARFADRRPAYVDAEQREVDVLMDEARRWAASRPRTAPGR